MTNSNSNGAEIRPNHHPKDEISLLWRPNTLLADLVYQPNRGLLFAIHEGGQTRYEDHVDKFKPLSWLQPLVTGGVLCLPQHAEPYGSVDELAGEVRNFIHRYFDCSAELETVGTLYVLHTWLYERFEAVPYLRFLGMAGSGKTRATQTIGMLCNRPLVISGTASTPAVFRQIEATGGTLLLDEGDFQNTHIGSDIVKILNNGYQRGFPVVRNKSVGEEWIPYPYDVYGPKIINGRRRFRDDATESRCLLYSPRQTRRDDMPRQLPASFRAEALSIRNRALAFRLATLDAFQPKEFLLPDLRPRTNEILMPLLSVAEQLRDPERQRYKADLVSYARTLDNEATQDSRDTVDAMLVNAYVERCAKNGSQPTCGDLAGDLQGEDESLKRWLNPRNASEMLKALGFRTRHTKRGSEINIDPDRLILLRERFAI